MLCTTAINTSYTIRTQTGAACRLTTKNLDQLRNPTLSNRVWAIFCCAAH